MPLQNDISELGHDTGVFLCFIKHVQFVHTRAHGQLEAWAYTISNFLGRLDSSLTLGLALLLNSFLLGAGDLLTDPQVKTDP